VTVDHGYGTPLGSVAPGPWTYVTGSVITGAMSVTSVGGNTLTVIEPGSVGPPSVGGDLSISNQGAGVDTITLDQLTCTGSIAIDTGHGSDTITITDGSVTGDVHITGGIGNQTVTIDPTVVGGYLTIGNAIGTQNVTIDQTTVGNDLTITNDMGGGTTDISGAGVGGDVSISTTHGAATTVIDPSTVGGDLTIDHRGALADTVQIDQVTVSGDLDISTAGGADTISLDDSAVTGTVDIDTGTFPHHVEADTVDIEQTPASTAITTVTGTVTVLTGGGNDTVNIGLPNDALAQVNFVGGITVDGGAGIDLLEHLGNGNVGTVTTLNVETIT